MHKTVELEKTLENPLDCKEFKPVNPKGNQSWVFIGKTDAKLKHQYFGHVLRRTDSFEKTLMLGKIEGRRWREDRGWDGWWHHQLTVKEFKQAPGVCDGGGCLACCSPLGHDELRNNSRKNEVHDWATELNFSNQMWTNGNCSFYNHSEIIVNT